MLKALFYFLFGHLIVSQCFSFSQNELNTFTVEGRFTETGKGSGIADLSVFLFRAEDSTLIKTEVTDTSGAYIFKFVKPGNYFISTDAGKYSGSVFNVNENVKLPLVSLKSSAQSLDQVTVAAKKPYIERQQGKLVLNVESSINSAGSSAFELIEKAPGVNVTSNDNITLNGKQGIVVQIDGKITPMSGTDLANYLRGIPSASIDKIELISNPSAKYDASGTAIINIKLKKDMRIGTNGSINASYGQGVYPKTSEGISVNHRNKKLNVYGSYNFSYRKGFNNLELYRGFYNNDTFLTAFDQRNNIIFPVKNHIARAGIDYNINKRNAVGIVVNGMSNKFNPQGLNISDVLGENQVPVSRFETENKSFDNWYNFSANANYKHVLDTAGSEITVDVDYAHFGNKNEQNFTTRYFALNNVQFQDPYILYGDVRGGLDIYSVKSDLVKQLKKKRKLEAGLKSSYVVADNNLKFFDRSSGTDIYDSLKSNHFIYDENINAGYATWSGEFGKWNIQTGLRAEMTHVVGKQLVNNKSFDTTYLQFFPNIYAGYKLNEKNTVEISYNRRIDRPGYDQLNPFKFYLDPTTYKEGNPYLRPQTTHTIETAYLWNQQIYASLGVSRTMNNITEIIAPSATEQNVTVQTNINLRKVDLFYTNISVPVDIAKWWHSTNNIGAYFAEYTGYVARTAIDKRGNFAWNVNTVNTFTLGKTVSAELTANYRAKEIYAYDIIQPIWFVSAGIQKKMLNNRAVVKLNVSDIFFTNKITADVAFTDYTENFVVKRETRVATIAVSYKFGNTNVQGSRRRSGGAEDLKQRVGGTNG